MCVILGSKPCNILYIIFKGNISAGLLKIYIHRNICFEVIYKYYNFIKSLIQIR